MASADEPRDRAEVRALARDARRTARALRQTAQDTHRASAELREQMVETRRTVAATLAEALAVTHISASLRVGALTSRCAWCGRYRIADRWTRVFRPGFIERCGTTHGICDDCIVRLRAHGKSV
ncbi:MAG: hypothetical protein JOY72_04875 [Actinobacteria bacterium]|nr:hypothetical protein [Actinomycetota bacterium]